MACVNSSSLPETARFLGLGRRKSQPRDDTSAAISQFDIDLQFFSLTFCASSITLLAWLSNGCSHHWSSGHLVDHSVSFAAAQSEKGDGIGEGARQIPFDNPTYSYPWLGRVDPFAGVGQQPSNYPIAFLQRPTPGGQEIRLL